MFIFVILHGYDSLLYTLILHIANTYVECSRGACMQLAGLHCMGMNATQSFGLIQTTNFVVAMTQGCTCLFIFV